MSGSSYEGLLGWERRIQVLSIATLVLSVMSCLATLFEIFFAIELPTAERDTLMPSAIITSLIVCLIGSVIALVGSVVILRGMRMAYYPMTIGIVMQLGMYLLLFALTFFPVGILFAIPFAIIFAIGIKGRIILN